MARTVDSRHRDLGQLVDKAIGRVDQFLDNGDPADQYPLSTAAQTLQTLVNTLVEHESMRGSAC